MMTRNPCIHQEGKCSLALNFNYVKKNSGELMKDTDLSKFIL